MSIENPLLVRLRAILANCGSDLAGEIDISLHSVTTMTYAVRRKIADVLMDEFLRAGLTETHDENEYGLEIEKLVDALELSKRF